MRESMTDALILAILVSDSKDQRLLTVICLWFQQTIAFIHAL
jgi:hypothetical protein